MSTSAFPAFSELLQNKLAGVASLSDAVRAKLFEHYELLQRWNRVLNLTSIDSLDEAVERHYCESIFLAVHLPSVPIRIADIGSGGGFPGIPVAVLRPDCEVTLIESHQRKAVFLKEGTRSLGNVRVLATRAQQIEGSFDHAISRAVSYEDLAPALDSLAKAADLLTGAADPPDELGFDWRDPITLPWGKQRFLRVGARRCFT